MEKYLNPALSPGERAQDLLEKLSLEEKMGQINCFFAEHEDVEKAAASGLGRMHGLTEGTENSIHWGEWSRAEGYLQKKGGPGPLAPGKL